MPTSWQHGSIGSCGVAVCTKKAMQKSRLGSSGGAGSSGGTSGGAGTGGSGGDAQQVALFPWRWLPSTKPSLCWDDTLCNVFLSCCKEKVDSNDFWCLFLQFGNYCKMLVHTAFWVCAHEGLHVFTTLQVGEIVVGCFFQVKSRSVFKPMLMLL